ncbi:MAG: site-specific integrase [Oscillospiraceae bacterium]|jgi:integrase|nr:site-specific integrase [Oscillospiraceae bacterium]
MDEKPVKTENESESKKGYHRKSNGEGSIFQRSDGRWCAKIQIGTLENGKPKLKFFYSMKYKTVKDKLNAYKALLNNNPDEESNNTTVDEFITNWLTTVKFNDLKPSSYDRLEATINDNIVPTIGYHKLFELTAQQIQEELINMMRNKNYSYSTIKKAYNAINACCKYAISIRRMDYNPVSAVSLPSVHQFERKPIRWFSNDEIKRFKEQCTFIYKNGKYRYPLGYGMIFIMNTGLRLGEALAIKWENVNWEKKQLSVESNVVMAVDRKSGKKKRVQINQDFLKTKSSKRIIPLNNTAIDALTQIKKIRYFGEKSYILCTETGTQNKPRNFCRTFEEILKRAEIERCGIHTLRHTFASKLFEKNVDVKTVSMLLGHADVTITYNIYIHLIQQQKAEAVQLLDEI